MIYNSVYWNLPSFEPISGPIWKIPDSRLKQSIFFDKAPRLFGWVGMNLLTLRRISQIDFYKTIFYYFYSDMDVAHIRIHHSNTHPFQVTPFEDAEVFEVIYLFLNFLKTNVFSRKKLKYKTMLLFLRSGKNFPFKMVTFGLNLMPMVSYKPWQPLMTKPKLQWALNLWLMELDPEVTNLGPIYLCLTVSKFLINSRLGPPKNMP